MKEVEHGGVGVEYSILEGHFKNASLSRRRPSKVPGVVWLQMIRIMSSKLRNEPPSTEALHPLPQCARGVAGRSGSFQR